MYTIPTVDTSVTSSNKSSRFPLITKHLIALDKRGLDNEWGHASCRTVTAREAVTYLGYTPHSDGIMFVGETTQFQFKPDEPELDEKGKPKKYLSPAGGDYDVFVPKHPTDKDYWKPENLKEACWKVNGHPCIVIDEGIFKAICGCFHGIPTISVQGVELGLTGKKSDPEGKRYLVPTLKKYAEAGLGFIVAFDADVATNPNVRTAEKTLALALGQYNVPVYTVTGKWKSEDGKGMDDFIQKNGIEAFRAILMKAQPVDIESRDTGDSRSSTKSKKPPTPREIAAQLAEQYRPRWKYHEEQQTWRGWTGKCWEKIKPGPFKSLIVTTLDAKGVNYSGIEYVNNVIEMLKCYLREVYWQTWDKSRYVNFENCVLDGNTLEILPQSPGMGFTSFLPFDYKPLAGNLSDFLEALRVNCPKTHQFFRTAMQGDERKMFKLLAIVNAVLKYRFFDLQMFVHLVGAPGSGKGKYTRWIQKMVGKDNTIACQLDKLSDGSTKASCIDKQAVIFPDERKPVGIDSILSLTGGDAISYRELYQPAASAHFYGSLLICSNKPIFIGDTTGLERRLCLVGFDNPIATEKRDHTLEAELDAEIPA